MAAKWLRKKMNDMQPFDGSVKNSTLKMILDQHLKDQRPYVNPLTNKVQLTVLTGGACDRKEREYLAAGYDSIPRSVCDSFFSSIDSTLFHEMGHVWAFQHASNKNVMFWYWITHFRRGDTHGMVKKPEVAFHEAFGEVFGSLFLPSTSEDHGELDFYMSLLDSVKYTTATLLDLKLPMINIGLNPPVMHANVSGSLECYDQGWCA